jgi:hypothetical protein
LKRQRHALALARQRSPLVARSGAIGRVWGIDLTAVGALQLFDPAGQAADCLRRIRYSQSHP